MRGKWIFLCLAAYSLSGMELSLKLTDIEGNSVRSVKQGVPFLVHVSVENGYQDLGEPAIEYLDTLDVCERRPITTNISIINGRQEIKKKYVYKARIDQVGTHVIGPAYYERGNQLFQSNSISFKVIKNGAVAQEEGAVDDPFMHVSIDKAQTFQHEQMLLTIRLCFRQPLVRFTLENFAMPAFSVRGVHDPEQEEFEYNGRTWRAVVYRYALYPQKEGDLIIPSLTAIVEREKDDENGFFGRFRSFFESSLEKVRLQSKPLSVHVETIPVSDKNLGLVGQVQEYSASLDKEEIDQGKGLVYTLSLISTIDPSRVLLGNLNLPEGVRSYESKRSVIAPSKTSGLWHVQREVVLQVLKAGKIKIPAQIFTYFDPEKKMYRALKTKPLTVSVLKSSYNPADFKPNANMVIDEKLPFIWPIIPFGWMIVLVIIPIFLMIGVYFFRLYRPLIGKIKAYRRFNRSVSIAYRSRDAHIIYNAWVELFVDRLNMPQREKELSVVIAPFFDHNLQVQWRAYILFLERMAFERHQQKFENLYQETKRWVSTLRVRV